MGNPSEFVAVAPTPYWKRAVGGAILRTQDTLTAAGERLGWEWLIYNPLVRYGFERAARRNAPAVYEAIRLCFPDAKTLIDVGCGTGTYAQHFEAQGLRAVGVEYSPALRRRCERKGVAVFPFDVSVPTPPPPGKPFDLAMSLEVAEHVPESLADAFVQYFVGLADTVIFTAAQPGQGGTNHINEQPREYWIAKFADRGFALDAATTTRFVETLTARGAFWYLPKNACVFRRR